MSEKIQYGDKSPYQTLPDIPENNKITAENINEIKKVVNNNAEELDTAQKNIEDLQNGQGTSNKDIADLKSKVSTLEEDNNTNKADISSLKKDNNTNKTNISNLEKNKVDKINGKQLSTNDFTNAYKEKLDKLKNYDDTEIKEDISNIKAEQIEQNSELDNLRKDISNIKEEQTQQNTDIEDLQAENNKLQEENEAIKSSLINVETEEEKRIHIEDAGGAGSKLEVSGNAEQEIRQGYNIFDYLKAITLSSVGGLTIDKDYSNGYITINGTPVNDYVNLFSTIDITDILEDGETYTIWQEKHAEKELDGVYMQVSVGEERYYSSKENTTFNVDKSLGRYIIGIQTGTINNIGTFSNYKNRYMLYKGTDIKEYELPGASPSVDYPSEGRCLGDNKNILKNEATNQTINGINFKINNNKSITAKGTATGKAQLILLGNINGKDEVLNFEANKEYKNVSNTDILYRTIEGDYGKLLADTIFSFDTEISIRALYIQINSGETVDKTYYPKIIKYKEGIDESYSIYGQGSTEIKKYNKNYVKTNNQTGELNGINFKIEDGIVNLSGTNTSSSSTGINFNYTKVYECKEFPYEQNVTFSCDGFEDLKGKGDVAFGELDSEGKWIRNLVVLSEENVKTVKVSKMNNNAKYVKASAAIYGNQTVNCQLKPMLEIGNKTVFEEHKEEEYILPIQQEMLEGDCFIKEDDGWKEVHGWGKQIFTGDENVAYNAAPNSDKANTLKTAYFTIEANKVGISLGTVGTIMSNMFKNLFSAGGLWGNSLTTENEQEAIAVDETIRIRINKDRLIGYKNDLTSSEKANLFKQFLKEKYDEGNPVVVYYKLESLEKLNCTDEQTEVLEQLSNLKLYKYTNNIFTAEDIAKLKLNYVVDTKKYIDNIIANTNKAIVERS